MARKTYTLEEAAETDRRRIAGGRARLHTINAAAERWADSLLRSEGVDDGDGATGLPAAPPRLAAAVAAATARLLSATTPEARERRTATLERLAALVPDGDLRYYAIRTMGWQWSHEGWRGDRAARPEHGTLLSVVYGTDGTPVWARDLGTDSQRAARRTRQLAALRRAAGRVREAARRAAETPEQRDVRLADQRVRVAARLAAESPAQRDARLAAMRAKAAARRAEAGAVSMRGRAAGASAIIAD